MLSQPIVPAKSTLRPLADAAPTPTAAAKRAFRNAPLNLPFDRWRSLLGSERSGWATLHSGRRGTRVPSRPPSLVASDTQICTGRL
jgi:hypothetical protein